MFSKIVVFFFLHFFLKSIHGECGFNCFALDFLLIGFTVKFEVVLCKGFSYLSTSAAHSQLTKLVKSAFQIHRLAGGEGWCLILTLIFSSVVFV